MISITIFISKYAIPIRQMWKSFSQVAKTKW